MSDLSEYISDKYQGKLTEGEEAEIAKDMLDMDSSFYASVSDSAENLSDKSFYSSFYESLIEKGSAAIADQVTVSGATVSPAGESAPVVAPFNYSVQEAKEGYTNVAGKNIKTMYLMAGAASLVLILFLKK